MRPNMFDWNMTLGEVPSDLCHEFAAEALRKPAILQIVTRRCYATRDDIELTPHSSACLRQPSFLVDLSDRQFYETAFSLMISSI